MPCVTLRLGGRLRSAPSSVKIVWWSAFATLERAFPQRTCPMYSNGSTAQTAHVPALRADRASDWQLLNKSSRYTGARSGRKAGWEPAQRLLSACHYHLTHPHKSPHRLSMFALAVDVQRKVTGCYALTVEQICDYDSDLLVPFFLRLPYRLTSRCVYSQFIISAAAAGRNFPGCPDQAATEQQLRGWAAFVTNNGSGCHSNWEQPKPVISSP